MHWHQLKHGKFMERQHISQYLGCTECYISLLNYSLWAKCRSWKMETNTFDSVDVLGLIFFFFFCIYLEFTFSTRFLNCIHTKLSTNFSI